MPRAPITTRPADLGDAELLLQLWAPALRRADRHEQIRDLELIVKTAGASPEQRLVVAEYGGTAAGAVLLRAGSMGAVNLEPCVHVITPAVLPDFRRRGVGRVLFEAATGFADELGVPTLSTAALAGSRDDNRFLARLGLGPYATLRMAPVHVVRAKLAAQRGGHISGARRDDRVPRLLAARRSMRRNRASV